jgi:predicted ArsR family transcriptional regulator
MSYMGVKELCDQMERAGLLDTWRQPQARGRPFKLYRLTQRAHELFPTASNPLTLDLLEASQKLFGATAPEKLLLVVYQKLAVDYDERCARRIPRRTRQVARPPAGSRWLHERMRIRGERRRHHR